MNTKYSNNVTTFAYSFSTNLLYASNMRTNYRKDTACSLPMQTYGFDESGGQGPATFLRPLFLLIFGQNAQNTTPKRYYYMKCFLLSQKYRIFAPELKQAKLKNYNFTSQ